MICFIGIVFYIGQIKLAHTICVQKDKFVCEKNHLLEDNNCEFIYDYVKKNPDIPCNDYAINWSFVILGALIGIAFYFG